MQFRLMLLWVTAGVLAGGVPAGAMDNSGDGISPANPMKVPGAQATTEPFDFSASPLDTQPIIEFKPAAPAGENASVSSKAAERSLPNEDGPAVIPLPPAAWTGAAGLLILGVALTLRRRLHTRH